MKTESPVHGWECKNREKRKVLSTWGKDKKKRGKVKNLQYHYFVKCPEQNAVKDESILSQGVVPKQQIVYN